jgi:tetratricopeptide (TPR) repeat protein
MGSPTPEPKRGLLNWVSGYFGRPTVRQRPTEVPAGRKGAAIPDAAPSFMQPMPAAAEQPAPEALQPLEPSVSEAAAESPDQAPPAEPVPPAEAPAADRALLAARVARAKAADAEQDWPAALAAWSEVMAAQPANRTAARGAVTALQRQGRLAEAEAMVEALAPRFPQDAWFPQTYAQLAHDRRDWTVALQRWAAMRADFPDAAQRYVGESRTLMSQRALDAADALLAEGTARFPEHGGIRQTWANLAIQRKDFTTALERWGTVYAVAPTQASACIGMVAALIGLERFEEAEAVLCAALRQHPDHEGMLIRQAELAGQRGDIATARARWAALNQRFPASQAVRRGMQRLG